MRRFLAALLALYPAGAQAEAPVLTVLAYDSFVSDWGPGPAITAGFEAVCGCKLEIIGAGDGAALLARARLEGGRGAADVVVGLDSNLVAAARASGLFAPHGVAADLDLPVAWSDPDFLPFDWGWFAFVHDRTRLADPPADFEALAASDLRIIVQDPRSSTPGLGLVMWIEAAYGPRAAEIWAGLADNIVTVTPGWSEAYGLFLEGEADMVLSYTTSPAYHLIAEGDDSKAAAPFAEGHYLQVEVAAMLAGSDAPDLARAFLAYLVSDAAQAVIPETNWMYPAVTPADGLPEGFATLHRPERSRYLEPAEAEALRGPAVERWRGALSR
ncbi:MAG: thiamine ABC transporter substrate binding subunit [Alphaproteobacteria bacterium]|nr:thiamine ABC transporter substrate binding subunit [Alphaproteobacteria bacterium]